MVLLPLVHERVTLSYVKVIFSTTMTLAAIVLASCTASALNKQGLPLPVDEVSDEDARPAQNLTGYVFGGTMLYNPSYAARPDNTGLALGRLGGHLDLDVWHKYLTIAYDGNVFTDRLAGNEATPSEIDHIVGLLTRHGDLELGVHLETDRPADRPGDSQSYVDASARYYFDAFRAWRALPEALPRQGWTGFFTLAGFAYNPTYAARPDLSGVALLRMVAHSEFDLWRPWVSLTIDLNAFTDRTTNAGLVPCELDTTAGVIVHLTTFDVSFVGENDRPVDRGGLQQSYVSTLVTYRFDAQHILASTRSSPEIARAR